MLIERSILEGRCQEGVFPFVLEGKKKISTY